ncbi:ABC transporter permease [Shumkonia mesophila]|uniref:ABC transporter permease n=1 Tax=Shumkonia mesophila TaxID=2838854 RepID=UPI002935014E|nr:ABC transporter permease [Shumkonia mesophila]
MIRTPLVRDLIHAEWMPLLGITVFFIVALSLIAPAFLTEYNLFVMLRILSVTGIFAMSQMIVIAVGQMNLAVGAIGGLVAILFGGMMEVYGIPVPLAALAGMAVGIATGWLNGAIIAYSGINGFVVTLAMLSIYTGLNYGITESIPFYHMPQALLDWYDGKVGPIPNIVAIPIVSAIMVSLFFSRTRPGRYILATGGNPAAAALSGISIQGSVILAHTVSGALAAFAGMVAVARLGTAEPTIGVDWLLPSFAAPVIGGAILSGGHVSVMGTMIAVVLIVLLENGLLLARTDPYYVQFFLGMLILAAVVFNRWRTVKAEKAPTPVAQEAAP